MFRSYEWKVALKYLSVKGHDGFVTVIALFSLFGIFLGVGALVVVFVRNSSAKSLDLTVMYSINPLVVKCQIMTRLPRKLALSVTS